MRSKNAWNKEYETKDNGEVVMVRNGLKPSKKSLKFSKYVTHMKADKPKWNKKLLENN